MMTARQPTLDELIAIRALVVEPKASELGGDRLLSLLRVELAPRVVEPAHTHPAVELLYGVAGRGVVELDARALVPIRPADVVQVERGRVKSLRNNTDRPFVVLAALVLGAGLPPLTPAPPEGGAR
jgi:quercetin dioxygenase-like cupin family protein